MPKHVIFLGAGFSAPLGLPTMRSFFAHIDAMSSVSNDLKSWLTALQREARGAKSMIVGDEFNLEHVLSLALMRHESVGPKPEQLPTSYQRITRLLGTVYRAIDARLFTTEVFARIRQLLTFFPEGQPQHPGTELTVITTNYDMMAEYALLHLGTPAVLPISTTPFAAQPPVGTPLYGTTGPRLCKLHGSVNWFATPNSNDPIRVEAGTVTKFLRNANNAQVIIPKVSSETWSPEEIPLIVPPMYFKHQTDERLNPNWVTASSALREADRLAFIGYSFPDSDTHMRYFLAAALHNNVRLKSANVVDPYAPAVCKRVSDSREFGDTFKQLLRPVGSPWQDGVFGLE